MTSLQNVCGFGGGGYIVFLRGLELKPYNLKRKKMNWVIDWMLLRKKNELLSKFFFLYFFLFTLLYCLFNITHNIHNCSNISLHKSLSPLFFPCSLFFLSSNPFATRVHSVCHHKGDMTFVDPKLPPWWWAPMWRWNLERYDEHQKVGYCCIISFPFIISDAQRKLQWKQVTLSVLWSVCHIFWLNYLISRICCETVHRRSWFPMSPPDVGDFLTFPLSHMVG